MVFVFLLTGSFNSKRMNWVVHVVTLHRVHAKCAGQVRQLFGELSAALALLTGKQTAKLTVNNRKPSKK